jgi:hypothetical protein
VSYMIVYTMKKHHLIFVSILGLLSVIILWTFYYEQDSSLNNNVPFITVIQDSPEISLGEYQNQEFLVIQTESDWEKIWNAKVGHLFKPTQLPPAVDFSREMIIAVFYGKTYKWPCNPKRMIEIKEINTQGTKISVEVTMDKKPQYKTRPGPPPLAMSPFHIIRLARNILPIEFNVMDLSPGLTDCLPNGPREQ